MRAPARLIVLLALALLTVAPGAVFASEPAPVPAPEGFAELRSQFEGKSVDEIAGMGYIAEPPVCVSHPELGGMGVHALSFPLFQQHFAAGTMDAQKPTVVLFDAKLQKVIGLEWEAADKGTGAPQIFGQPALLLPGHEGPPGTQDPHYMLHAYFRSDGQVLFAPFDPEVKCPLPDTATADAAPPVTPLSIPVMLLLLMSLMLGSWVVFQRRLATRR